MNSTLLKAPLSLEIQREYERLKKLIAPIPAPFRMLKEMEGTGGKVSVADLIAYQIGWGQCVIRWYEAGIKGEMPAMPCVGFSTWDYVAIAQHFYQKYHYDHMDQQDQIFDQIVRQLLDIIEKEHQTGRLEQTGIWSWCTLQSGKQWPLSKWIRINACSPYKRAHALISKNLKK